MMEGWMTVMRKKKFLNELIMLRAIACISIVTLHAINQVIRLDGGTERWDALYSNIAHLLSFGTPTFVCISIILLSHTYKNSLPKDFYRKRIKYILMPYLAMAIFYGIVFHLNDLKTIPLQVIYNIFGNFHGWFVLLIFQCYVMFHFFHKFAQGWRPSIVLSISLFVNLTYLGVFTLTPVPENNTFLQFIWEQGYWIPFFGWCFYFTFAYYFGLHYKKWLKWVQEHQISLFFLSFLSICIVLVINKFMVFEYGSKRMDMIFLSISFMLLLLSSLSKVNHIPSWLGKVSDYSYGIYLLHFFFIVLFREISLHLAWDVTYYHMMIWTVCSIVCSMGMMSVLKQYQFGQFIVGRIPDQTIKRPRTVCHRKKVPSGLRSWHRIF